MAPLLRAVGTHLLRTLQPKVGSRNFSAYNKHKSGFPSSVTLEETKLKLKTFAKNSWDGIDPRVQNVIIDGVGKCVILMVLGHGYLLYLRSISDRQDKIEARQAEIQEESEKVLSELKAEVESVSRYREESEVKHQKLETELRELKFLKELWMSTVYQESSKAEAEPKSE